jgi:phosphoserine phosphatase
MLEFTLRPRRRATAGPILASIALASAASASAQPADPLSSWNDTASRRRIVEFVKTVSEPGGKGYVPPAERVAVFDNDGTLWAEQPMYVQLAFALDRVKTLAPEHPEWKTTPPFSAALAGDAKALAASGEKGLLDLIVATHAGMTTDEFAATVSGWLATARHPRFGLPYTGTVYKPMLELLAYLRANGFRTWIVSGGGIEMVRAFSERVYGVPPEQVVGSTIATEYRVKDGVPGIVRLPKVDFVDDKAGKPVGIQKFVGRRPILAFGNSDGDYEMLEWTTSGPGPRLGLILRHDDAEREYAYDRKSPFGRLDKALDEAPGKGWRIVSMKDDWNSVFPAAR